MKVALVYGISGSGKTSIIQHIADRLSNKYKKKVGLIIYDEGEVQIEDGRFPLKILPKGCLPCETATYFGQILSELYINDRPDVMIIEPSGTTLPRTIVPAITYAEKDLGEKFTFCPALNVIDPRTLSIFFKTLRGIVKNGVTDSDYVIINKVDTAPKDSVSQVEVIIKEIQPEVKIIHASSSTDKGMDELSKIVAEEFSMKYGSSQGKK
jgi:G3E family GTPase